MTTEQEPLVIHENPETGLIDSVTLYGEELLASGGAPELLVNQLPLTLRPYPGSVQSPLNPEAGTRLKGERFTDHFSGYGLVLNRHIGHRNGMKFHCTGVRYLIRRELADYDTLPCPGPGGPANEAPCWIDSLGLLNWNWKFWGDKTRMIFPSSHTQGPCDEFGHVGYEHDTPARCKQFLQNVWRRTYPSTMTIHGGMFYNVETGHWLAITCRRPHVGYRLNLENAGDGVSYDFLLHAMFGIGETLRLPEIKIYYGRTREEMYEFLGYYTTFYVEEAPDWVYKKLWIPGTNWDNKPTWSEQADYWEREFDRGSFSAIAINLVTNRPIKSGTLPIGYEPDPNHGPISEFKKMCHRMRDRGIPMLIWMSHSGLVPGSPDIDDDWFIRGIDGQYSAGWGNRDGGMVMCNPGHPGYIAYTKKWVKFYIQECGCKGIFFDCLGWVFPPDYRPRSFMRFPADTNLLTIRFQTELYNYIKELDPEAVMMGEGASLDAPVDIFSIVGNPVRAIDGMGPRDYLLWLNRYAPKRMTIPGGGLLAPGGGMCEVQVGAFPQELHRFMVKLLAEKGGKRAFEVLNGDISILDNLLFFPRQGEMPPNTPFFPQRDFVKLPERYAGVTRLVGKFHDQVIERGPDGYFRGLTPGIYEMR